jgi:Ran GTPase-activating protein (RanGAP) involved in mRNA processing and transport
MKFWNKKNKWELKTNQCVLELGVEEWTVKILEETFVGNVTVLYLEYNVGYIMSTKLIELYTKRIHFAMCNHTSI